MKKIIFVTLMLFLAYCTTHAYFLGHLETSFVSNSNIYNDFTELSDNGAVVDLGLNYYGKISDIFYPRLNYSFWSVQYPDFDYENENINRLSAMLKMRLSNLFTAGINGGINVYDWPQAEEYDSFLAYGNLFGIVYPTDFTEIEAGGVFEKKSYPDYYLDYEGARFYLYERQGISNALEINLKGSWEKRSYTEQDVYDPTVLTNPASTGEAREDISWYGSLWVDMYLPKIPLITSGYEFNRITSNANEFYWGAAAGDNDIIPDYWDFDTHTGYASIEIGSTKKLFCRLYGHVMKKRFAEWLARNTSETVLYPYETREDTQYVFSVTLKRELWKHLLLSAGFERTMNDSNDIPYDYQSNKFNITARFFF